MKRKYIEIIPWVIFFELVGFLLGLITQANVTTWYPLLNKSSLTPPPIVFSIVWPVLYAMLAVCAYLLWQHRKNFGARVALVFFTIQLVMNWSWTPLFFYFHYLTLSFFWIVAITILTLITIFLTKDYYTRILLIPYFLWLVFATYLSWSIWVMN